MDSYPCGSEYIYLNIQIVPPFFSTMFHLPQELIREIYDMDPTKRFHFDKVYHQLRMRQVWYEAGRTYASMFQNDDWLHRIGTDNPDCYSIIEEMYDAYVGFMCKRHRILGNKPRLPFDELDLMF